jgi:hypothetical protein
MENIDPSIPPELCRVVRKALRKEVDERYQDMDQMLKEMGQIGRCLERRKDELWSEVRQKVEELECLEEEHRDRLRGQTGSSSARLARLIACTKQSDLSYMTLVGLRDGASLELRRVRSLLEDVPDRSEEPTHLKGGDRTRAETLYQQASLRLDQSDLAGCLTLLCEALRLQPDHSEAGSLEDRLRVEMVHRVNREDETHHEEVLAAALLALDTGSGELAGRTDQSGEDPELISQLSDLLLSELDPPSSDYPSKKRH